MELSEKQLLLLSAYMYMPQSVQVDKTIREVINELKDSNNNYRHDLLQGVTGGSSVEEAEHLLTEIEKDDFLLDLEVTESLDTGIRCSCFKNSKNPDSNDVVLAFRGSGGISKAWADNFRGLYQTETMMQQEAITFVNEKCKGMNIQAVTGHSKGGNLAQCVSVALPEKVGRCVSFDGQGFSGNFIKQHQDGIDIKKKDIVSISSYKDPVSTLLTPVAGIIKYIKTDPSIKGFDNHKGNTLYNKDYFDKKGNYNANVITSRHSSMEKLHYLSENVIQKWPEEVKRISSEIVGPVVGVVMAKGEDLLTLPIEIGKGLMGEYNKLPLEFEKDAPMNAGKDLKYIDEIKGVVENGVADMKMKAGNDLGKTKMLAEYGRKITQKPHNMVKGKAIDLTKGKIR